MVTSGSKVQQFLLHILAPIMCSIAVGFVFNQGDVFDRHYGAFQFVWSAVVAAVFYYLLVFVRFRDALLGFTLLFLFTFLTTESTRPAFILRDIFYVGGIGLAIFLYFHYVARSPAGNHAFTPFMLAGIYAIVYIIASEIHLGILRTFAMENTGGTIGSVASACAFFGVLIGFALGCGISLNDRLWGRSRATTNVASV
jgi:hypothetical protein